MANNTRSYPWDVLHIRGPSEDGIIGLSPVTICREAIGLGLDQQKHGKSTFENGAMPLGAIEIDKPLTDGKAQKIIDGWNLQHQGTENTGKTAILEAGAKFRPISVSNADAEWLASREFTIVEIARMYRIPKMYLQDYSGNAYSNVTEARRALLTQCLLPWIKRFEQALERDLLQGERGLKIKFDTREYMRADTMERYQAYEVAIRSGLLTVNEAREMEGLPPVANKPVVEVA